MTSRETVVVVGAGHGGVQVAVRLAELEWAGGVVLVDEHQGATYQRPPLSKEFLLDRSSEAPALRKDEYFDAKGIQRLSGRVSSFDRDERRVLFESGGSLGYDYLVLATGASARRLAVPGEGMEGVHYLRTLQDARRLRHELETRSRVVIIGAGYIGLEIAAACTHLGASALVLEAERRVMSRTTSDVVADHFRAIHESNGVRFAFGDQVARIDGDSRVRGVTTQGGATYPADLVLVGIGVQPRQDLAQRAGLGVNDGVLVDVHGRTSDPRVFAVGDVARVELPQTGASRRLESVPNAQSMAINAANAIAGEPSRKDEVPWFWTVQHGVRLQTAGLWGPEDDIVVRGSTHDQAFTVLYVRDGRLRALDAVGALKDFAAGKRLIASGALLDLTSAADPSVKLGDAIQEAAREEHAVLGNG